uniref:Uncharacterized protein n=1 Tax=Anopheles atroparvus TaxID=41427 RepID=A0A182JHH8_ANOAO
MVSGRGDTTSDRVTRSSTRSMAEEASEDADALVEVIPMDPLATTSGENANDKARAGLLLTSRSTTGSLKGRDDASQERKQRPVKHVRFVEPDDENSLDEMVVTRARGTVSPHPLGMAAGGGAAIGGRRGNGARDDGGEGEEEEEDDDMDGLALMEHIPPVQSMLVEMDDGEGEEDDDVGEVDDDDDEGEDNEDDDDEEMEDDDDYGGRRQRRRRRGGSSGTASGRGRRRSARSTKHDDSIELELEPLVPVVVEMGEGDVGEQMGGVAGSVGGEGGDSQLLAPVAQVCRVCLCDEKDPDGVTERKMESLYCTVVPEYQSRNLYSILVAVCHPLHLGSNAGMPDRICLDCKAKLLTAYELYDTCLRNDELLRRKYHTKLVIASNAAGEGRRIKKERLEHHGADNGDGGDDGDYDPDGAMRYYGGSKRGALLNDPDDAFLYARQYPLHMATMMKKPTGAGMAALRARYQQAAGGNKWNKYQRNPSASSSPLRIQHVTNGPDALRQIGGGGGAAASKPGASRSGVVYDYNSFHRLLSNGSHQCTKCLREFKYHSYYKNHFISQHDPTKPYKCRKCHYTFRHERWLISHMRTHVGQQQHLLESLAGTQLGLAVSQRDAALLDGGDIGQQGRTGDAASSELLYCTPCDQTFPTYSLYKRHMLMHSSKQRCPICDMRFHDQTSLLEHLRNHKTEKQRARGGEKDGGGSEQQREYVCTVCSASFARESLLTGHMQEQHPEALLAMHSELLYMCRVCLVLSDDRSTLDEHFATHSDEERAEAVASAAAERSKDDDATAEGEEQMKQEIKKEDESSSDEQLKAKDGAVEGTEDDTKKVLNKDTADNVPDGFSAVYRCKLCQARFAKRGTLESHVETHVAAMKRTTSKRSYNESGDGDGSQLGQDDDSDDDEEEDDETSASSSRRPKRPKHEQGNGGDEEGAGGGGGDDDDEEDLIDPDEVSFHPDTGEQMFTCRVCGKVISTVTQFRRHKRVHSAKGRPYECHICYYRFAMKYSYTAHMLRHELGCDPTQPTTYRCSKCSESFTRRKLLNQHIAAKHGRWSLEASAIAELLGNNASTASAAAGADSPAGSGSGRASHTCPVCSETFTRESVLNGHMKTHNLEAAQMLHSEVCYLCRVCSSEFESRALYEAHAAEAHPGTKTDMMPESGDGEQESTDGTSQAAAATPGEGIKVEEGANEEGNEPRDDDESMPGADGSGGGSTNSGFTLIYKCKLCSGRFLRKKSLDWHLQTHRSIAKQGDGVAILPDIGPDVDTEQIKLFKCTVCGQMFDNQIIFQEHVRTHQLGRAPRSSTGGYGAASTASTPPTTTRRKRSSWPGPIIQCHLCKKTFTYRSQLHQHTVLHHQPGKPYECKICHYSFVHELNLKRHELLHLKEAVASQTHHAANQGADAMGSDVNSHLLQPLVLMADDEANGRGAGAGAGSRANDDDDATDGGTGQGEGGGGGGAGGEWTKRKIKCVICAARFDNQNELVLHLQTHIERINEARNRRAPSVAQAVDIGISPNDRQCKLCHKVFKFSCQLKQHHVLHHAREKPFECRTCHYRFEFKGHLVRHRANLHPDEPKDVYGEGDTGTPGRGGNLRRSSSLLDEGGSGSGGVPKYGGMVTDDVIIAPTTSVSRSEAGGSGGVPTHQCPMCSLKFIKARSLAMHMRIHLGGRKLRRVIPATADGGEGTLDGTTPLAGIAGGVGAMAAAASLALSAGEKQRESLVCRICAGTFSTAHELKTHLTTHIGGEAMDLEVPFGISAFNMLHENMFNDSMGGGGGAGRGEGSSTGGAGGGDDDDDAEDDETVNYRRNVNLMQTPSRSRYGGGGSGGMMMGGLRQQQQQTPSPGSSTSGKGKIVCELCKKEFLYPCNLNQHKTLHHSKDKPHECRVCHYRFEYIGHLQRHIRQQHEALAEELLEPAEPQTFDCTFCGESFEAKPLLTAHVQTNHRGEKPFQCDKCPATFTYKKSYETHREEHHLKSNNGAFKCSFCKKTFNSAQKVDNHVCIQ